MTQPIAMIVPLYKGKGRRDMCKYYRRFCLLSVPGNMLGIIIIESERDNKRQNRRTRKIY